ncbi:MAG: 50S ribosomal protein L18 [Candidatus Aenigmatarchaeota archaeon]
MQYKRRSEKKTDYQQRFALLKSGKARMVVRRGIRNIRIQFVTYADKGDITHVNVLSKSLSAYGWKGHCGNICAAYLTGMLAGKRAIKAGIKEAVLDAGLQITTKSSAVFAAAMGARDAGISIPLGDVADTKRISGKHIAEYAKLIKQNGNEKQFSLVKKHIEPENIESHFESVKKRIEEE